MAYSGYKTVVVKDENEEILYKSNDLEAAIDYAAAYYYAKGKQEKSLVMVTDINDSTAVFWSSEELMRPVIQKSDKPSVYFDMDGTLAFWHYDGLGLSYPDEILDPRNHYYRNLKPHSGTIELAKLLHEQGYDVCVMSAADIGCRYDKKAWLQEHCPFIPKENIFFCPIGADKTKYIKGNVDKSILIDDYNKNLNDWANAGGKSVKLINSINSINPNYAYIDINKYELLEKKAIDDPSQRINKEKALEHNAQVIKNILEPEKKKEVAFFKHNSSEEMIR